MHCFDKNFKKKTRFLRVNNIFKSKKVTIFVCHRTRVQKGTKARGNRRQTRVVLEKKMSPKQTPVKFGERIAVKRILHKRRSFSIMR